MEVGHTSIDKNTDANDMESYPVKQTNDVDDASSDKFLTELLDMVGGSRKRGLAIVVGGVLFSLLLGMWAMGVFTTQIPDLDAGGAKPPSNLALKLKGGVKRHRPRTHVGRSQAAHYDREDADIEPQEVKGVDGMNDDNGDRADALQGEVGGGRQENDGAEDGNDLVTTIAPEEDPDNPQPSGLKEDAAFENDLAPKLEEDGSGQGAQ